MGRGTAKGSAIVKASGAFGHASDVEISDLDQDSNGCLHVPAQFSFFSSLHVDHHVAGCQIKHSDPV